MSSRGLIKELDEKQRGEVLDEIVGSIRIAKKAWDTVITNGILSKEDVEVRRCLFDKCIGHLPFLIKDILGKEKGATDNQKKYFLDLCKNKTAEEIARLVIDNVGVERVEMIRVIDMLKGGRDENRKGQTA
ncbi:MAG: hypothetical protein QMC80_02150 [Thermoplasmatales archaeon]|nr:hypothetical protein [Thermoplasmatales archaeon]